jgi:flagellar biosynthesis GTPase FlhF
LPEPRIHLVLNAAYESAILVEQFRLFSRFHPEDLSLTHLDEERDQAKMLDFIQGTNCCLRFLSTGQKIPGDLVIAGAESRRCPEFAA